MGKTGKSTYLKSAFPNSLVFDLLQTDLMLDLARRPAFLRERLLAAAPEKLQAPVILDEVQKVPQLLDEVHGLIENRGLSFILCGSRREPHADRLSLRNPQHPDTGIKVHISARCVAWPDRRSRALSRADFLDTLWVNG